MLDFLVEDIVPAPETLNDGAFGLLLNQKRDVPCRSGRRTSLSVWAALQFIAR